jgi:predicted dehydrogenase
MIRAAIIGISGYGRIHLRMAREQARLGRLRLDAAVVVNALDERVECERLVKEKCRIFADTDALWSAMAGQIDLCFIPTAIHLHSRMAHQAMAAGAHVLVEKPLTASIGDADELISAAARANRFVAVGFQDIYTRSTQTLKSRFVAEEWGAILAVRVIGGWPRAASYYLRNNWAGRVKVEESWVLDSPISNGLAHFINLALYLSGSEAAKVARFECLECDLWRARPIENYDTCSIRLRLPAGALLTMHATHSCHEEIVPRIEVSCERGAVIWTYDQHVEITAAGRPSERFALESLESKRMMVGQAVVSRILGEPEAIFDASAAREHVRLFATMQTSAKIRDIDKEFIEVAGNPADPTPAIRGIEAAIAAASAGQRLFSDTASQWSSRPSASPCK